MALLHNVKNEKLNFIFIVKLYIHAYDIIFFVRFRKFCCYLNIIFILKLNIPYLLFDVSVFLIQLNIFLIKENQT